MNEIRCGSMIEAGAAAAIVSACCGGMLVFAAFTKCRRWKSFRSMVAFVLEGRRDSVINAAAALFVSCEIILGILLVLGVRLMETLVAFVLLMIGLTFVLTLLARRGYAGGCGCFGESSGRRTIGWLPFVRNGLLVVAAPTCIVMVRGGSIESTAWWTWPPAYWAVIGVLLLVGGVIYRLTEAIVDTLAATVPR